MSEIDTRCVHAPGGNRDPFGASVAPLYQTATFRQAGAAEFGEYDYTRSGNPTRDDLEARLAALEGGAGALAYASGMAATSALVHLLAPGDEVVAGDDLYGGTTRLFERLRAPRGITVRYADASDAEAFAAACTPRTKLLFVETPTNPLLRIADLRGLAALARARGALLAVDNSLLSPVLQRPLELGADLVVASATKFLGGHADVTAGVIAAGDPALLERLAFARNAEGNALAPFEAWLLARGLKTLALRVRAQCAGAQRVAEFLAAHPRVAAVHYPGLPDHPGRAIHAAQASGAGAVLSFTTGDAEFSRRVVEECRLFSIAVSFGAVHSVITLPGKMSHASIPPALRDRLAPPPDLIRLSVGIEAPEDLLADLAQALEGAESGFGIRDSGFALPKRPRAATGVL